jgi:cytochrome c553
MVIVLAMPRGALAQISPGPLSKAHQSISGLTQCTSCHRLGTGGALKCLECHAEIQQRLTENRVPRGGSEEGQSEQGLRALPL